MRDRTHLNTVFCIFLLLAVAVLFVLYVMLGVFHFDKGIDFWLLAIWAALVVVFLILLRRRTKLRERIRRRFYLSNGGIYNFEIGYAPFERVEGGDDALVFSMFAVTSLVEMSYGFEVADLPDDFEPRLLVTTDTLVFHRPEGDVEFGGAVVDKWKGSVLRASELGDGGYEKLGSYGNARELAFLLDENWPFER